MRRVFRLPFLPGHIAREVDDELAFHLEQRTARLVAAGWSIDAARAEALRQFGNLDTVRESCVVLDQQRERAMDRADFMGQLVQDAAYALRTLRRNLASTAVIVVALAVGIGANTAIFTLVNAVIMRSLPVRHPEQLVAVGDPARTGSMSQGAPRTDLISYPLYRDLRAHNALFAGLLASGRVERFDVRIEKTGEFEHPHGRFVSGNYFDVLGVRAALGRTFDSTADLVPGASPVATISYGYWTTRFHNDRSVVGRTILVDGVKLTIVGVAEKGFSGEIVGQPKDVWVPIGMHDVMSPSTHVLDDRASDWLLLLGRLKPGATFAQAQAVLPALIKQDIVANADPQTAGAFVGQSRRYYVEPGARGFSRVRVLFEAPLVTLMIGVALLLCIICANVANLLLARAIARGREMAVRLALGAARARLIRQLLTESAVLAVVSAGAGLFVAWMGSHALIAAASRGLPIAVDIPLDVTVLAFTTGISIVAVALFGVVPAIRASRVDLASTMRAGAVSIAGSALGQRGQRIPLGRMLIAAQVALSVVLLVGAAMLVRSLRNVANGDVGMDRDHLVIADVDIASRGYDRLRRGNFAHEVRDKLAALPGVAAVSYSENGIFSGTESETTLEVPGFQARAATDTISAYDKVGPGYVAALGAHLVAGRDLAPGDEGHGARVVVANAAFAKFYFPNENAVGKYVHLSDSIAIRIVGVVADTRDHSLTEPPARRIYFPYVHTDTQPGQPDQPASLRIEIRTVGNPADLVQPIRRTIAAIDPLLPIDGVVPLRVTMAESIQGETLLAQLATAFGLLALGLAAIGLYGVMTYAVTRRTNEMGLRVALGAQRADVIRMMLFDALRLVLAGLVVGLPLALAAARLLRSQLHGVGVADPTSIAMAVAVLAVSAVVAAFVPASRASRVSPIVALRAE